MNEIQKRIYDKIVRPAVDNIAGITIGVVVESSSVTQTARVRVSNHDESSEIRILKPAPIMTIGGVKQSAPLPGDTVMVAFLDNKHTHPIIIGKVDLEHQLRTREEKEKHFRSGSHITDYYNDREGMDW